MFANNVVIAVPDGTTTTYGLLSVVGSSSQRGNAAAPIGAPDLFRISHEISGKGDAAVDRHLIRVDLTKEIDGETTGVRRRATASAYVVLVVPHSVVTKDDVREAFNRVKTFLNSTEDGASSDNLERVLNSEP
nr:MAG: coat protein [Leviviridae sp.]